MNKHTKYALSDLYDMSSGLSSTKKQAGHGAPFLSFSTVFNNYFLPDKLLDLMDTSKKEQDVYSVKSGDIFLTRTSESIDELAMSSVSLKDYPNATYSGFLKRLRPKTQNIVYEKYIAYYLRSKFFRKTVTNNAFMTLRASFNEEIFSYLNLYLPKYSEQVLIGDFFYNIEEIIKNNNAINAELEALAKTIYDYWFLQFEFPNEEGLPYKSSGGRMVWSEELKREIPEGWGVEKLGDIVRNSSTSISARKAKPYPYTPLEKIPSFKMSFGDFFDGENAKTSLLYYEKSAILFGSMRPYFHRVCIAPFSGVTRTTTFVLYPTLENTLGYAYETLNQNHVVKYATNSSVGTQQPYVEWANSLEDFKIPHVPDKLKIQYSSLVQNMIELVIKNEIESHSLSELRDWLLPMLMNGQVGFKDTE